MKETSPTYQHAIRLTKEQEETLNKARAIKDRDGKTCSIPSLLLLGCEKVIKEKS